MKSKSKFVLQLISLVILFSCITKQSENSSLNVEEKNNSTKSNKTPILIDTLNFDYLQMVSNEKLASTANYLYFGVRKDSLLVGGINKSKKLSLEDIGLNIDIDNQEVIMLPKRIENTNLLKVFVDTSQIVGKYSSYYPPVTINNKPNDDSDNFLPYKAYPVFVETKNETDTLLFGHGYYIDLIVEAKDSLNVWKPIEKHFFYVCDTGLRDIVLLPNYVVVSSVYIYKGNFETTLRVKCGENYSNEYFGSINYSQFI